MFGLAVAIAFAARQDGPPPSAAACFNGACIVESWPRSPYILFFVDGRDKLDAEGEGILADFAGQHRWWPHLKVGVCAPAQDARTRARVAHIWRGLASGGYRRIVVRHEGRGCTIIGGARRSAGHMGYQLDFLP